MSNLINSDSYLTIDTESVDTLPILDLTNTSGNTQTFFTTYSPEGVLVGDRGDVCIVDDGATGSVWVKSTGVATNTLWVQLGSGGGAAWLLDGNTEGIERYIGTNDNFDFPIDVNATEMLRVKTTGNVQFTGATNINDAGDIPSLNIQMRQGLDGAGTATIGWATMQLWDSTSVLSMDWGGRLLYNAAGAFSIDYDTRILRSQNPETTYTWQLSNTSGGISLFNGSSIPETVVTGDPGDLFVRDTGVIGELYIKGSGSATNTGWLKLAASSGAGFWELDGNTGQTDNVDNILGSTDNVPIRFMTNSANMATMHPSGQMEIYGATGFVGTESTLELGAANNSYAMRLEGGADVLMTIQNTGADLMYLRTQPGNSFLTSAAGSSLHLGVGGTTQSDLYITPTNQVVSRRETYISDTFAGSAGTYNSLTFQGNATGVQSGAWRLININPQTTNNTGGTTTGIRLDMTLVTGGTNLALDLNTAQANTSAITRYANSDGDTNEFIGNGSPEGVVTGSRGDIYRRLDGTGQIYQKTTDAVNTGWVDLSSTSPTKYYVQMALPAGTTTITHSLGLATPKALIYNINDDATGQAISVSFSNYLANSVDVTVAVAVALANITII